MLPESGILDGHKGVDQILRKFFIRSLNPVGIASYQSIRYFPFTVIDGGKISAGGKAVRVKIGSIVQNSLKHARAETDACDSDKNNQKKAGFKYRQKHTVGIFLFSGTGCLYLLFRFFSAIIHRKPPLNYNYSKTSLINKYYCHEVFFTLL